MFAVHRRFDKLFRASETSYQSYAALACGFWFLTALACPSPFVDLLGRDGTGSRYCGEDAKASPSQSSLEQNITKQLQSIMKQLPQRSKCLKACCMFPSVPYGAAAVEDQVSKGTPPAASSGQLRSASPETLRVTNQRSWPLLYQEDTNKTK